MGAAVLCLGLGISQMSTTPTPQLLAVMAAKPLPSPPLLALMGAYETGAAPTIPARKRSGSGSELKFGGRFVCMPYQKTPDRVASLLRRKNLAIRDSMPKRMLIKLTECQRAYAQIVRERHEQCGQFDLCHDEAAARMGCCAKSVQLAQNRLRDLHWIDVEIRERPGQKNDTNIIRIVSPEWLNWIDNDPRKRMRADTRVAEIFISDGSAPIGGKAFPATLLEPKKESLLQKQCQENQKGVPPDGGTSGLSRKEYEKRRAKLEAALERKRRWRNRGP